jgi:hypothetical protein
MKPIEGEPAFPSPPVGTGDPRDGMTSGYLGMTLREWYIGQALMGICANPNRSHWKANGAAAEAIKVADAVMQLLYPQTEKETNQ